MCSNCANKWATALHNKKAEELDAHCVDCGCEAFSLRMPAGNPVASSEYVVRILAAPRDIDASLKEVVRGKLTSLFSSGISVVREGVARAEFVDTVKELISAPVPAALYGAVIIRVDNIRLSYAAPRRYCVYDTSSGNKQHHADIVGTIPKADTSTKVKRTKDDWRYDLAKMFNECIVEAASIDELISAVEMRSGIRMA
jgi:hypothetical protein